MRVGCFSNPWNIGHARDYLNEVRELARTCEQGGCDDFWLAEHHFSKRGWPGMPHPGTMRSLELFAERVRPEITKTAPPAAGAGAAA